MAESTQRLSVEGKANYPDIPWTQLAGFRNVLVHAYLGIRHELVWQFIADDLFALEATVRSMLVALEADEPPKHRRDHMACRSEAGESAAEVSEALNNAVGFGIDDTIDPVDTCL